MKFVYVVLKNADFTEGRGPMVLHLVFESFEDAHKYIQDQQGIYGSKQDKQASYGDKVNNWCYNGYEVKRVPVATYESASIDYQKEMKKKALSKLTEEEKHILGIKE